MDLGSWSQVAGRLEVGRRNRSTGALASPHGFHLKITHGGRRRRAPPVAGFDL